MKVCPACGTQYGDDAAFCARDRTPLNAPGRGLVGTVMAERYRIERKLGEGGMGEVYLARHVLMDRLCAIKVVSPSLTRDPDSIGRFNREATNASRISHPNVCAVYDFGLTQDGLLYLAMEYVEGRTLTAALTGGPLELARAVAIVDQCAQGLSAAHELGIVHRDLKPDNVMLQEQRGREIVKLVDFGIAKAGTGDVQRVTRTGLVVGTPEYMSPEQLSGDELDGRSDQYSLALVFFRMVTGDLPFTAGSAQEVMTKRLTERPRPLVEVAPSRPFPAGIQQVLDRALERKRDDRFPSVEAFAAAVRQAASEQAAVRIPRTRPVAPARRWRTAAMVGSGIAVAAVAWLVTRPGAEPLPAPVPPAGDPPVAETTAVVSPDSIRSPAATTRSAPPPAPVPVPAPAPSPAAPATDSATIYAEGPPDDDFDDAASPVALRAAEIARRIADNPGRPAAVRARNAFNYAFVMGVRQDRAAAKQYYQLSCALDRQPRCTQILEALKDVP